MEMIAADVTWHKFLAWSQVSSTRNCMKKKITDSVSYLRKKYKKQWTMLSSNNVKFLLKSCKFLNMNVEILRIQENTQQQQFLPWCYWMAY